MLWAGADVFTGIAQREASRYLEEKGISNMTEFFIQINQKNDELRKKIEPLILKRSEIYRNKAQLQDLLSDLFFYAKTQNLVVAACNVAEELLLRAHRFRADVLVVDEDTYLHCRAFAGIAKALKVSRSLRVILLVKHERAIDYDEELVDETLLLSRDAITNLLRNL